VFKQVSPRTWLTLRLLFRTCDEIVRPHIWRTVSCNTYSSRRSSHTFEIKVDQVCCCTSINHGLKGYRAYMNPFTLHSLYKRQTVFYDFSRNVTQPLMYSLNNGHLRSLSLFSPLPLPLPLPPSSSPPSSTQPLLLLYRPLPPYINLLHNHHHFTHHCPICQSLSIPFFYTRPP